jgi:hypothetical protein
VLHRDLFHRFETGADACVAAYSPAQSFALIAGQ